MLEITGLGHVNIVVNNIDQATEFYMRAFGAKPISGCDHLTNEGFAKSAGFLENASDLDVSIRFLKIEGANLLLELMEYHSPKGVYLQYQHKTNDMGGIRHICLNIKNIDQAFSFIKDIEEIRLVTNDPSYKPFCVEKISVNQLICFNDIDTQKKEEICNNIAKIRFFYFIDPYGVQWEFEER